MNPFRSACLLSVCLLLPACGGGGDSGGDDDENAFSNQLRITSANALSISAATVGTVGATVEGGDTSADILLGVDAGRGVQRPDLTAFSQRQLRRLAYEIRHGPTLAAPQVLAAVTTLTSDCDNSLGSFNITVNDADNSDSLTSADSFSITFNNCYDALEDASYDGAITLNNVIVVGDPETDIAWQLSSTFIYDDLGYTDDAGSERISGNVAFAYETTDSITFRSTQSSAALTYRGSGGTTSLRSLSLAYTENINTLAYSIEANGILASSVLGGSIEIETLAPLSGLYPDAPDTGAYRISGADDCSVTLTVIDDTNVQLDIDQNGDDAIDGTISTTWGVLTLS